MFKKISRSLSKHVLRKEEEPNLNFIDELLPTLLNLREEQCLQLSEIVSGSQLKTLCKAAVPLFLADETMLLLQPPIKVLGDIHGQYFDLLRLFDLGGHPPETRYLFLGDYVDRGAYGIEVMALLLIYKIKYPDKIFMIRGNHECDITSKIYGFCDQCLTRFSYRLWERFCSVFDALPVAAIIGPNFFCVHGGLSPLMSSIDQINDIPRPGKVLDGTLLSDLVWSDPELSHSGWLAGKRGISGTFGLDMLDTFLDNHEFTLLIRAHQVAQDGYEFFDSKRRLVTLFSAPNYCGTRGNRAGIMTITSNTNYYFETIAPMDALPTTHEELMAARSPRYNGEETRSLPLPPLKRVDSEILENEVARARHLGFREGDEDDYDDDEDDDDDYGPPLTRQSSCSSQPGAPSPRANALVVQEMSAFRIDNDSP